MTVIKTERPKKKATAHICTDSVGGLVTIYYDLSEQLTIPCEVIQISFSPTWISTGFFSERVVLRLVTTSLFFVISYITWSWVFDQIVHMCRMHRDNLFSM